jgi:hypothetical protein
MRSMVEGASTHLAPPPPAAVPLPRRVATEEDHAPEAGAMGPWLCEGLYEASRGLHRLGRLGMLPT